jgi:DNA-binding XRE family transcriptional regulator
MPTPILIKKARDQAGLTQTQAANLIGVSRVTWTRWETGITPPPAEPLWRFWLHVAGLERIPFSAAASPKLSERAGNR